MSTLLIALIALISGIIGTGLGILNACWLWRDRPRKPAAFAFLPPKACAEQEQVDEYDDRCESWEYMCHHPPSELRETIPSQVYCVYPGKN